LGHVLLLCNTGFGDAFNANHFGSTFYIGLLKNFKGYTTSAWLEVTTFSNEAVPFTVTNRHSGLIANSSAVKGFPTVVSLPLNLIAKSKYDRHKGIEVATVNSTQLISVAVYDWEKGSVASYIVFPCHNLFLSSYEYVLVSTGNIKQPLSPQSQGLIIGSQDNTTITISPSVPMYLPFDLQMRHRYQIHVYPGQSHTYIIHKGQSLYIGRPGYDISGTSVRSSKPVAVFSGHECGNVPKDRSWCEHMIQQIPPTVVWGKEFLLVPFLGRDSGQYYKVITSVDNTQISQTCRRNEDEIYNVTRAGSHFMIFGNSSTFCHIKANKPIMVAQLATGGELDQKGDPIMVIIQPVEQYTDKFTFNIQPDVRFNHSYVSIVASADDFNNTSILMDDDVPINELTTWETIYNLESKLVGYGAHFPITEGVHTINMLSGKGSVMIYGFNTNPHRGYGHTTAVQLKPINYNPKVQVCKLTYFVKENSTLTIKIKRILAFDELEVYVVAKPITADKDDYKLTDGVITFGIEEKEKEMKILITDDDIVEQTESFYIDVTDVYGQSIMEEGPSTVIVDDDDSLYVGYVNNTYFNDNQVVVEVTDGKLSTEVHLMLNAAIHQHNNHTQHIPLYNFSLTPFVKKIQLHVDLTQILLHHEIDNPDNPDIEWALIPINNNGMNVVIDEQQHIAIDSPANEILAIVSSSPVSSFNAATSSTITPNISTASTSSSTASTLSSIITISTITSSIAGTSSSSVISSTAAIRPQSTDTQITLVYFITAIIVMIVLIVCASLLIFTISIALLIMKRRSRPGASGLSKIEAFN
jgi:hypothetical protein